MLWNEVIFSKNTFWLPSLSVYIRYALLTETNGWTDKQLYNKQKAADWIAKHRQADWKSVNEEKYKHTLTQQSDKSLCV